MRTTCAVFLAAALSLPAVAAADAISSVSPPSIYVNDVEEFVTISGSGLTGTDSTLVVFSGPGGTFAVEPSNASSTSLEVWVPAEVAMAVGHYTVTVQATDTGSPTRVIGPGNFDVNERPPDNTPPQPPFPEVVVSEATSPAGAIVTFDVGGSSCDHASGSLFPLGTTLVTCMAGSLQSSFEVVVTDTTPPVLTVPSDIHAIDNPVVTFTATATDNIDGTVPVTCSPASGSTFPAGTTTVRCEADDAHLNIAVGEFDVTYSPNPALTLPANILTEAQSASGANVSFVATADLGSTVVCAPASGALFPFGTTTVNCTATASAAFSNTTSSGSFAVTVRDTTPPALTIPTATTVEATSAAGAAATFTATSSDLVDGTVPVSCVPASGSIFPFGTTTVQCSATDALLNTSHGAFTLTVQDTTPPAIHLPSPITVQATSASGAIVTYTATATDAVDGNDAVTCAPASGSTFPVATTTVQCSATDLHGNAAHGAFTVTVQQDITPPVLHLPNPITAEATSGTGATVTFTATAIDNVDGSVPVTCTPASGSTFALGITTVQCTATDLHGNTAKGSFTVTVRDTTPPEIIHADASPNVLWPPNHKMTPVKIMVVAHDAVDPSPFSHILSVASNQPVNGTGDGNTSPDWEITGPLSLNLRAERQGDDDRIYTITIETRDFSNNSSTATILVRVTQTRGRATH